MPALVVTWLRGGEASGMLLEALDAEEFAADQVIRIRGKDRGRLPDRPTDYGIQRVVECVRDDRHGLMIPRRPSRAVCRREQILPVAGFYDLSMGQEQTIALRTVKDLRGYAIRATDGVIGKVDDLYFDDEDWAIRYLVVDTGGWLSGRKVLISPIAIGQPDWLDGVLPVALTKAKVEHAPDIDTRKPVSRQHEAVYLGYYGYPFYWGGAGMWGMGGYRAA